WGDGARHGRSGFNRGGILETLTLGRSRGRCEQRARASESAMAKNIYVGNLPYETTGDDLVQLFQPYGSVVSGQVVMDRFSGRSRGFGFVEMADDTEAQAAIDALNGQPYGSRPLTVNEARPRTDTPRRGYAPGGP